MINLENLYLKNEPCFLPKSSQSHTLVYLGLLGAVHILRQPPEGEEGVSQMLTIADEGGRDGQPNADFC